MGTWGRENRRRRKSLLLPLILYNLFLLSSECSCPSSRTSVHPSNITPSQMLPKTVPPPPNLVNHPLLDIHCTLHKPHAVLYTCIVHVFPKGFLKPEALSDPFTPGTHNGYSHTADIQCLLEGRMSL